MKNLLKVLVFTALGLLFLYWIFNTQQKNYQAECALKGIAAQECSLIEKLKSDFSKVNYFFVFLAFFTFFVSNFIRAKRWEMLLKPIGINAKTKNSLSAINIAYLVNLVIPRGGEVARATSLSQSEDIAFDKVFGTIVLDRILDFICLLIVSLLTFFLAYDKIYNYFDQNLNLSSIVQKFNQPRLILIGLFASITLLFLFYRLKNRIVESKIGIKLQNFLKGLIEGLTSIYKLEKSGLFLFYSFTIWFCYFLMAYWMFKAYPPTSHLGLVAALVVFFFGSLGIVFPAPGGMGSYHYLAMESLSLYGIAKTDGFVYANLVFFSIQIIFNVVAGLVSFIVIDKNKR